jgi:tetratricopeptide (TPR) repeat protein
MPWLAARRVLLTAVACAAAAIISVWLTRSRGSGGSPEESRQAEMQEPLQVTESVGPAPPANASDTPAPPVRDKEKAMTLPVPATPVVQTQPPPDLKLKEETGSRADSAAPSDQVAAARAEVQALKTESLQIAEDLVRDYPNSTDGLGLLGMVYNDSGETAKAWQCWEQVLQRNPRRTDACAAMAGVALRKGEYERAAELCRKGLADAGETPDLHRRLGEALNGMGRPEEAVGQLQRAVQMAPNDAESHYLLGACYSLLDEFEKARASYQKAIDLQPADPRPHYGHAMACAKLGLEKESQESLQRSQKLHGESMMGQRSRRGILSDAIRYRRVLARTCCGAAVVYLGHHNLEKAEKLLRRGAAADPQDTACRMHLAVLLLQSNRGPEAIGMCKELVAIEPNNARHHLYLAMIYSRLQQFDAARLAAQKAVELAPGNEDCRRALEQLQERR